MYINFSSRSVWNTFASNSLRPFSLNTWVNQLGLPDGYSHIFRLYVFGNRASGLWLRYAALQNLIPFSPWIAPAPCTPPWRNPRKGGDQILPSGNTAPHLEYPAQSAEVGVPPSDLPGGLVREHVVGGGQAGRRESCRTQIGRRGGVECSCNKTFRISVARWQNLIPCFPWIVPGWRAWGAIQ